MKLKSLLLKSKTQIYIYSCMHMSQIGNFLRQLLCLQLIFKIFQVHSVDGLLSFYFSFVVAKFLLPVCCYEKHVQKYFSCCPTFSSRSELGQLELRGRRGSTLFLYSQLILQSTKVIRKVLAVLNFQRHHKCSLCIQERCFSFKVCFEVLPDSVVFRLEIIYEKIPARNWFPFFLDTFELVTFYVEAFSCFCISQQRIYFHFSSFLAPLCNKLFKLLILQAESYYLILLSYYLQLQKCFVSSNNLRWSGSRIGIAMLVAACIHCSNLFMR